MTKRIRNVYSTPKPVQIQREVAVYGSYDYDYLYARPMKLYNSVCFPVVYSLKRCSVYQMTWTPIILKGKSRLSNSGEVLVEPWNILHSGVILSIKYWSSKIQFYCCGRAFFWIQLSHLNDFDYSQKFILKIVE